MTARWSDPHRLPAPPPGTSAPSTLLPVDERRRAHPRVPRRRRLLGRDLALDHAAGRLEDGVYLDRLRALLESKESLEVNATGGISVEVALAWLQALSATWTDANVPEAKADVLHAIHGQMVVTGRAIISIRLTPSACAHGLALALPEKVVLARPTGVGRALATYDIPIVGRDEWLAAARRLA